MVLGIDHIAISAGRLQGGVEYVEAALGVPLEAGGRHLRFGTCLLYTSPSPRDRTRSRMPSSA